MDESSTYDLVNSKYSALAASKLHFKTGCETSDPQYNKVAESFGYSATELASLPDGTNLGLSCGNPLATANLLPHEVLIDLGSGGGLDCFVAAKQMASLASGQPEGKVYGIDASRDMISLARRNASKSHLPQGLVEFIEAPITHIPLNDGIADLVISNCVINLVPGNDKHKVFSEIHRLLKPGGRLAVSDILARKELPDHIRQDAALIVGCVAGASLVGEYRSWMIQAGFSEESIVIRDTDKDLNVYKENQYCPEGCCGRGGREVTFEKADSGIDFNAWVGAYQIYAVK